MTQRLIKSYLGGPHLLDKWRNRYFVWRYDNTIYVIGNPTTNNYFQLYRQLPYSKTFQGFGPDGEDVIFEVDPKVRGLTSRLVEQFQRGPRLTYSWKNELFIWRYLDDIYVIGKSETGKIFKIGHKLPFQRKIDGMGPNGEDVIFEEDKKGYLPGRPPGRTFFKRSASFMKWILASRGNFGNFGDVLK